MQHHRALQPPKGPQRCVSTSHSHNKLNICFSAGLVFWIPLHLVKCTHSYTMWLKEFIFIIIIGHVQLIFLCIMTFLTECFMKSFVYSEKRKRHIKVRAESANGSVEYCKLAKIKMWFCSLTSVLLCFKKDVKWWLGQCEWGHLDWCSSPPDVQYVFNVSHEPVPNCSLLKLLITTIEY